jgi:hypothetical protein
VTARRVRPAVAVRNSLRKVRMAEAVRAAVVPWAVARVLVLLTLALAHFLVSHTRPAVAGVALRVHEGLLGWDAGFYRDIALKGYGALGRPALRFFPLVPMLARGIHDVTRLSIDDSLILLVNAAALVAGVLLYVLAVGETGDEATGRRAVWLLAVSPASYVLVMGYAEAVMLVLVILAFVALRSGRWWLAALAGYLSGLSRPLGVLVAAPALVEAARNWRGASRGELAGRVAAVLAPIAGMATYFAYVGANFGDFWLPLRVQQQGNLHGKLADPVTTVANAGRDILHHHIGTALHVPWLAVFIGLLVVSLLRWPSSYGLFALLVLATAVSSSNLDSIERYAMSAFPLLLAAATITGGIRSERAVLTLLGGGMASYALLAFMNLSVP